MHWFYIAIVAPFLWAATNHIDKYLLSKYVRGGGIGSLVIFSCLFSTVVLPVIAVIAPSVLQVSKLNIVFLIILGVINTLAVLLYLYALHEERASIVIPFFQLIPVFGFLFGYVMLGEVINLFEGIAAALIIFGAILLTIEFNGEKVQIRTKVVTYMTISAVLFALHGVLFKFVALEESFSLSIFWEYVGLLVTGIFFLFFIKPYRNEFLSLIGRNGFAVISLNFINESLVLIGNLVTAFAFTVAPVVLVLSVAGFQPLFVILIELIIILFMPKYFNYKEKISVMYFYRFLAILIILYGGYLLNIEI